MLRNKKHYQREEYSTKFEISPPGSRSKLIKPFMHIGYVNPNKLIDILQILWSWNLPTKQKDIHKLHKKDEDFSKRVSDWLDQVKSLNSPILLKYANKCPDCECELTPIPPTIAMFKKGNKKNGPPLTCECLSCKKSFSSYQLNLLYVDKYALEYGIAPEEYSSHKVDIWAASCEYLDTTDPFQLIVFTLSLLQLQFHYWHHAKYVLSF